MCTSVPQMPVFWTRMRTSLIPIVGSGMSSSQRPRSRLLFTNAFIEYPHAVRAAGTLQSSNEMPGHSGNHSRTDHLPARAALQATKLRYCEVVELCWGGGRAAGPQGTISGTAHGNATKSGAGDNKAIDSIDLTVV